MINRVTDPSKIVTDELVLKELAKQGIDAQEVEFFQDYAPRSWGKEHSSYAKFYRHLNSNKRFMVVSGLPKVKPDGTKIEVGWVEKQGNKYRSKPNLFSAVVDGKQITVTCLSNQPSGSKEGEQVTWQPQLFLDGVEQTCGKAVLLDTDPINQFLHQNVLEWDYGVCQRRIRIIEGRIRERWIFEANPHSTIRIKHNITGSLNLKLGKARDAKGNPLLVSVIGDEEIVEASEFDKAVFPVEIGASPETFYPDAHVEGASVDGRSYYITGSADWSYVIAQDGSFAEDNEVTGTCVNIQDDNISQKWRSVGRGFLLFDTSPLPDTANITAGVLSIRGHSKVNPDGHDPDVNIFSSTPATNTAIIADDHDQVGSTPFCDTYITYAAFDVADYNDFTFNAAGRAAISKTSISKFSTRMSYDVTATPPAWDGGQNDNYLLIYYAEQGAGYKPKLVVTYCVAQAVGGGAVGIAGTLSWKLIKETGEGSIAIVGALGRSISRGVGDGAVPIVGSLSRQILQGVSINDIAVKILKGSLIVSNRIEERSIAEFSVVDIGGLNHYQKGQPILIYDSNATLIFGGSIHSSEEKRVGKGKLYHYIRCVDYHYLADKRLAAESYSDKTAGFIVNDLFNKYLAPEGITIGEIQTGPTIIEAIINYVRVSDAYNAIDELTGFIWYIDELKKLYFIARATNAAPWNWSSATPKPEGSVPRLLHGNPKYRNRQYIRGGRGTTDLQTETFIGDGVTVAFTVGFPLQKVPASITVADRAPEAQTIGIKGIDVAFDCYWNKGDATITFAVAPENTKAAVIQYYGQYDILVLADDPVAIAKQLAIEGGGTGYVDDIASEPTLDNQVASVESGIAKLAKFGVLGKRFTYQTTRSGLKPGQLQTTNYPLFGLNNAEMLIEAVKIRTLGELITYDITEIQGPATGGWSRLFKVLATEVERLQVGTDQTLILLVRASETWGWNEEVVVSVFACPVPADDLYPDEDLYPC